MPAILNRTPTQVNAKGLLREVQAAEEGLEAGFGAHASLTDKQRARKSLEYYGTLIRPKCLEDQESAPARHTADPCSSSPCRVRARRKPNEPTQ